MAGYLTTHVLDTARGCPAQGLRIALFAIEGETRRLLADEKVQRDIARRNGAEDDGDADDDDNPV